MNDKLKVEMLDQYNNNYGIKTPYDITKNKEDQIESFTIDDLKFYKNLKIQGQFHTASGKYTAKIIE